MENASHAQITEFGVETIKDIEKINPTLKESFDIWMNPENGEHANDLLDIAEESGVYATSLLEFNSFIESRLNEKWEKNVTEIFDAYLLQKGKEKMKPVTKEGIINNTKFFNRLIKERLTGENTLEIKDIGVYEHTKEVEKKLNEYKIPLEDMPSFGISIAVWRLDAYRKQMEHDKIELTKKGKQELLSYWHFLEGLRDTIYMSHDTRVFMDYYEVPVLGIPSSPQN